MGKATKYRYLYFIERTTNKSRRARRTGRHEVKIGVTNNVPARFDSLQKTVKGQLVLILTVKASNSYSIEQALHSKYSDVRFKMAGNGNGETEWFRMKTVELLLAHIDAFWLMARGTVFVFLITVLGLICLYLFYLDTPK